MESFVVIANTEIRELANLAYAQPQRVVERGEAILASGGLGPMDEATLLRSMAVAARMKANLPQSIVYAARSVDAAARSGDADVQARALMTLAGSETLSGNADHGIRLLDDAAGMSSGTLRAEVEFQRASILARLGRSTEAERIYRSILPVFVAAGDVESRAMTLQNLGMLSVYAGDPSAARSYLSEARNLHKIAGNDLLAASALHNLGMVAAYEGDVVEAFRLFDQSEGMLTEIEQIREHQVSRCDLLLSVGLFREARALSEVIAASLQGSGLGIDEAEAWLVAAQAALAAGTVDRAQDDARRAAEMFRDQGRSVWEANANQIEVAARLAGGEASEPLLGAARHASETLASENQAVAALNARNTAAKIAVALGDMEGAVHDLREVARRRSGPVELRVQSWLATALLREIGGDRRGVLSAARAGLELIDRYQAAIGASDVRAGVANHGRELGEIGLRAAVSGGRARMVFEWMERTRANVLRYPPVAPPDDEAQASDLTRLRTVAADMRTATGSDAARLARESRKLQDSIRVRSREVAGVSHLVDRVGALQMAEALGPRALVELAIVDGELISVSSRSGRFSLHTVCDAHEALREIESLRFNLRRAARQEDRADKAVEAVARFDELLGSAFSIDATDVVIVPVPDMYAAPWGVLPTLRRSNVTVAPMAAVWKRNMGASDSGREVVVVGGPDLRDVDAEVAAVAAIHPECHALSPSESRAASVAEAMDGVHTAHIASHAFFQFENPMFSSLRLADGDLYVYDIERLERPPDLVVLSACDSGFTETHPGEELLGLTSALLAMGTKTVIASVGLVPDSEATRELMVCLHRRLADGVSPSVALHEAQQEVMDMPGGFVAAASFICIGAG